MSLSVSGSKSVCATLSLISLHGASGAVVRQGSGAVNGSRWPLLLGGVRVQPPERLPPPTCPHSPGLD